MELRTYLAVGELAQAAAHLHGVTGPVPFTVCRPHDDEWCANCGDCPMCNDDSHYSMNSTNSTNSKEEEFFYAQSFC